MKRELLAVQNLLGISTFEASLNLIKNGLSD